MLDLDEDVVLDVMERLNLRELLTARLVCKPFCRFASAKLPVKGLQVGWAQLQPVSTTTVNQLSGLTRLEVSIPIGLLPQLAQHTFGPIVTHIKLDKGCSMSMGGPEALAPLMLLPKLHSLNVIADADIVQVLPIGLRELILGKEVVADVSGLTRLSGLARLQFDMGEKAAPSLGSLTGLVNLRCLQLGCSFTPLGVLTPFTMLISLTLRITGYEQSGSMFADLVHLCGLLELDLSVDHSVTVDELACLSHLTNLTFLNMLDCKLCRSTNESALGPLTGLAYLGLNCGMIGMSLLSVVHYQTLRFLYLNRVTGNISVLTRATRLEELNFSMYDAEDDYGPALGSILPQMSRLSSLHLDLLRKPDSPAAFQLGPIARALTRLTCLSYSGSFNVAVDLQACASLPHLRVLALQGVREVTAACIPDLQLMTGLNKLTLKDTGFTEEDLTPEVRGAFDDERLCRGWPRLNVRLVTSGSDSEDNGSSDESLF